MRTFKEVLAEAEHFISSYGKWGIATKEGLIYGHSHKTATSHDALAVAHGQGTGSYAEFVHEAGTLNLRTYGGKSARIAHEHFDSFPHGKKGDVVHDHFPIDGEGNNVYKEGKRYQIEKHLAKMGGITESLDEAQHYIPDYARWGIVSKKRGMVSGDRHGSAETHDDLHSREDLKSKVEYAQDTTEGSLSLRTHGKAALKLAVEHFPDLPHVRGGMVTHTHFERIGGMKEFKGKSYQVLSKMKAMAA